MDALKMDIQLKMESEKISRSKGFIVSIGA